MQAQYETIVLGLGAMGSASIYQLAKRRNRVLGIDQFALPHHHGSTHGESRIIRQAIGEGEQYMPLVLRSYELWQDLAKEIGQKLLTTTGGLILEPENSAITAHGRHRFLAQTISCFKFASIATMPDGPVRTALALPPGTPQVGLQPCARTRKLRQNN